MIERDAGRLIRRSLTEIAEATGLPEHESRLWAIASYFRLELALLGALVDGLIDEMEED